MSTPVEQIKSRLSIVDVIGGYVRLQKAGSAYKALCPFHTEKTPSFTVSPTRQSFHCFGCNKGGDIFTFIEEIEGLDFPGALKVLAEKAGVELTKVDRKATTERERWYSIMETATRFYISRLTDKHPARKYLKDRGLTDETIEAFRIGFAPGEPEGWHALSEALNERKISDAEIERVGLSKRSEKTAALPAGKFYDRFRSRIMFPIFDSSGRVIAFSGRIFSSGETPADVAKYVNSPETPLYDKSGVLFGFDRAKSAIRKQNFAVIVEGQMDLIMAHQGGTENTVAVSGTALTERHLALLKRLTQNVVFAFDGDTAGLNATARAFSLALSLDMNVRVAELPKGKDPADLVREDKAAWEKALKDSKHIVNFLLSSVLSSPSDALATKKAVEERVLPYVAEIRSSIEQAHFVLEIARVLAVPDKAVWDALQKIRIARTYAAPKGAIKAPEERAPMAERLKEEVIGLLLWRETEADPKADLVKAKDRFIQIGGVEPMADLTEAQKNQSIVRVEQTYDPSKISDALFDDLLTRYDIALSEGKQAEMHRRLTIAEREKDKEGIGKYLEEFQTLSKHVHELKGKIGGGGE